MVVDPQLHKLVMEGHSLLLQDMVLQLHADKYVETYLEKIVKMFQEVLGVYTLYSQSLSDFGHRSDSAFGPIYIQSMFESESETLEHTKKGKEHFLLLAYTNSSFVWVGNHP